MYDRLTMYFNSGPFDPDSMASFYFNQDMNRQLYEEYADEEPSPPQVACKFCGADGFVWEETTYGWRLVNDAGKLHHCKAYRFGKGRAVNKIRQYARRNTAAGSCRVKKLKE